VPRITIRIPPLCPCCRRFFSLMSEMVGDVSLLDLPGPQSHLSPFVANCPAARPFYMVPGQIFFDVTK